jgi:hypothetical protein
MVSRTNVRRAAVSAVVVGVSFAVVLIASRHLGGRAIPFWLENTAGIWFVAAFVAGVLGRRPLPGGAAGATALVVGLVAHDSIWFVSENGMFVQVIPAVRYSWVAVSFAVGASLGALGGWAVGAPRRVEPAVGLVGGLLFFGILVLSFVGVIRRYVRGEPLALAVLALLVVMLGQWLTGGLYALLPLFWFLVGWGTRR